MSARMTKMRWGRACPAGEQRSPLAVRTMSGERCSPAKRGINDNTERPPNARYALPRQKGSILVAVLVSTVLSAMVVASLVFRMQAESAAAGGTGGSDQAYSAAISGLQKAMMLLAETPHDMATWYDDEETFRNQFVCDDGTNAWYFTIFAPNEFEDDRVRYGLSDLGGGISLNTADEQTLLRLPNMTQALVDCLIDYRDPDAEPRAEGAEDQQSDHAAGRTYSIKNGPLATLEELLLVKGFDATILYGEDANFNGMLEPNEDDGDDLFPPDDSDGQLNRGLRGCAVGLTRGKDVTKEGRARYNLNIDPRAASRAGLGQKTQEFIKLYRAEGKVFVHPSQLLKMRYRLEKPVYEERSSTSSRRRRGSSRKRVKYAAGTWVDSGVDEGNLAVVMDKLTARGGGGRMPTLGLVNVNTAPFEALTAIEGIDDELARAIVEDRHDLIGEIVDEQRLEKRSTTAWLYAEGLVDDDTFRTIAPRLCARGYQFHVQCVGFGWPDGRFCVIEAVIDITGGQPQVIYLRDLTRLGLPFAIDLKEELGL